MRIWSNRWRSAAVMSSRLWSRSCVSVVSSPVAPTRTPSSVASFRQLCDWLDAQDPQVLANLRRLNVGEKFTGRG
ncbi:hypothetical protein [Streptomyces inhibens]